MKNTRKKAVAVLAGLAVAGIAAASATSLGGLNPATLGADSAVIAACQTSGPIDVDFTTNAAGKVTQVTFSKVDAACNGLPFQASLRDAGGASLGNGSGNASSPSFSFATNADANAAAEVRLLIAGRP